MTNSNTNRSRKGLTLIEVVIVLGVIALLAGMILPAIRHARESARRTQCQNNLKQIGLSLHNYHDIHTTFPSGYVLDNEGPYLGWGWSIMLTAMEQSPYYSGIQFSRGLQRDYDRPDLNRVSPEYRCPSDQGTDRVAQAMVVAATVHGGIVPPVTVTTADTFSRSNYFGSCGYLKAAVEGIQHDASGDPTDREVFVNAGSLGHIGTKFSPEHRYCDQENFQGVFGQNSRVRIKDIEDGTSNVFLVGERSTPVKTSAGSVGHGTWLGVPDCSTAAGLAMSLGDTSLKPNAGSWGTQTTGFSSNHRSGAQFLRCDGSVRFVASNIGIGIYRDLSTIADHRSIGEF